MAGQKMATPYYIPSSPSPTHSSTPANRVSTTHISSHAGNPWLSFWQRIWHTLKGQFILIALVCLILSIILSITVSLLFQRAANDLNTIAYSSIPSVNSAQMFAQYIDDIDAKSADYLATATLTALSSCSLVGPNNTSTTTPQPQTVHNCDKLNIDAEIPLANHQLYLSAHNVTFPGEETAVERITAGLEQYVFYIKLSQQEYGLANGSNDPHNVHLQQAYQAYKQANQILSQHITVSSQPRLEVNVPVCQLPSGNLAPTQWASAGIDTNVDCLSWINKSHVDSAYTDTMNFLGVSIFVSILLCFLFCALLLFAVVRMAKISHRVINIGLSLALLVGLVFSGISISLFASYSGNSGTFKQIVKDSYGSVYAAALLERYATNANADESRWLIAKEFNDPAAVIYWANDWQANKTQVESYIRLAQRNQTYPEELSPLSDMASSWKDYTAIDTSIRSTADDTSDSNSIAHAESISTGQSNAEFSHFISAVVTLSNVNNSYYTQFLNTMNSQLSTIIDLSAVLFVLLGFLAAFGIYSRMKDF